MFVIIDNIRKESIDFGICFKIFYRLFVFKVNKSLCHIKFHDTIIIKVKNGPMTINRMYDFMKYFIHKCEMRMRNINNRTAKQCGYQLIFKFFFHVFRTSS